MTPQRWRQVEEMYQSTMDREPEARAAWLQDACGADEELRREVESLLKLNSAPAIVDQPAWQAAGELLHNDSNMAVGAQVGPYRIEGVLGAGGMGQVYRARDTRLDRAVAIKVSREEFGERFEREARAVAALNHPNVCTLHDVGPNYLVMELVEGPTLAERIKQGPIPLEEALAIARQIGDALDAAHEAGIVHRDLKPGNIKVKPDGTVKVLDFGLAKRRPAGGSASADPRESPTISMAATRDGMILGTAAYMSPEQARGQEVDKRADIWAFGVVLYEMLTGSQLFMGATVTDTLAAVLTKEPDWSSVPGRVRELLPACLERDPKRRLRDIGDIGRFLDERHTHTSRSGKLPWVIALCGMVAAAVAAGAWWRAAQPTSKPLVRLDVDLGPGVSLSSRWGADAILSPDGTRLVYLSNGHLFTRRLDQAQAIELAPSDKAVAPFFSPDGQWVGYYTDTRLKKVSVNGGGSIPLCDSAVYAHGASWGDDGYIIASLEGAGPLVRIPASGGAPVRLTELDRNRGEVTHRWPQVLPGSKAVLFTTHTAPNIGFDEAEIDVFTLADGRKKAIERGATFGRYLPTGHLVYVNKGTLFAVRFDLRRLETSGEPVRLLEQVAYSTRSGTGQFDASNTGELVYRTGAAEGGLFTLQRVDADGQMHPLLVKAGLYGHPVVSPDGKSVALLLSEGANREVWLYDLRRNTNTRLTFGGDIKSTPLWTPDSRFIVFQAAGGMYWVRADGTVGKPQILVSSNGVQYPWSFAPDGSRLAFFERRPTDLKEPDIWTIPIQIDAAGLHAGKPEPFLQTPFNEMAPAFSPDGRWIAYSSNESGIAEVYVRAFPDQRGKSQISEGGGTYPRWSRSGNELYFFSADGHIRVASYSARGASLMAEKPRQWSARRFMTNPIFGDIYDVAPDGKGVIALVAADLEDQPSPNHVMFLMNFFDELRRRMQPR